MYARAGRRLKRSKRQNGRYKEGVKANHRSHYTVPMSVYLIVNVDVRDPAAYEEYKAGVPALIRKHGGEYLVRGGQVDVLEGEWRPKRVAVIKFPSSEAVHAFRNDPEYAGLMALRHRISSTQMVMVEGV